MVGLLVCSSWLYSILYLYFSFFIHGGYRVIILHPLGIRRLQEEDEVNFIYHMMHSKQHVKTMNVQVQTKISFTRDRSNGYPKFVKSEGLYKGFVLFWRCQIPYALRKSTSFGTITMLREQCHFFNFNYACAMTEQLKMVRKVHVHGPSKKGLNVGPGLILAY